MYLAAQTIAVGLEQVILDRAVYGGDFLEQFATAENKLAMVRKQKNFKIFFPFFPRCSSVHHDPLAFLTNPFVSVRPGPLFSSNGHD